jgi:4a-hydroxytetrahydrobiopterin dehydratase
MEWQIKENKLYRRYNFKNYSEALSFVIKVSKLAEKINHHPDISFGWGYVELYLYSHDKKTITDRDHMLKDQISEL